MYGKSNAGAKAQPRRSREETLERELGFAFSVVCPFMSVAIGHAPTAADVREILQISFDALKSHDVVPISKQADETNVHGHRR